MRLCLAHSPLRIHSDKAAVPVPPHTRSRDFASSTEHKPPTDAVDSHQHATESPPGASWRPTPNRPARFHRDVSSSRISITSCSTCRLRSRSSPSASASSIISATKCSTSCAVTASHVVSLRSSFSAITVVILLKYLFQSLCSSLFLLFGKYL